MAKFNEWKSIVNRNLFIVVMAEQPDVGFPVMTICLLLSLTFLGFLIRLVDISLENDLMVNGYRVR